MRWSRRDGRPFDRGQRCALAAPQLSSRVRLLTTTFQAQDGMDLVMQVQRGLTISVSVVDDFYMVHVSIGDGVFAGSTRLYENLEMPTGLATTLRGFPISVTDRREHTLGTFGPGYAGGAVRLVFRTADMVGHAVVEAELEDEPSNEGPPRTLALRFPIEPAAIDDFAVQLDAVALGQRSSATLRSTA